MFTASEYVERMYKRNQNERYGLLYNWMKQGSIYSAKLLKEILEIIILTELEHRSRQIRKEYEIGCSSGYEESA